MTQRCVWAVLASTLTILPSVLAAQDTTRVRGDSAIPHEGLPRRDALTGKVTLAGTFLRRFPIDDPRQALHLVPGVLARGAALAPFGATQVSIRGGTSGQTGEYLDGAPVRVETLGTQPLNLSPVMVRELSVETGVAGASVWEGWHGVVSHVTPSGGAEYHGRLRAETDEAFSDGSAVGYNRFEGALGGPVPGVRDLTFFAAMQLQGQRSHYRGIGAADQPTYVLGGLDTTVQSVEVPRFVQWSGDCDGCVGLRRPMDWATDARVLGKLEYAYAPGSRVSVTGLATGLQERHFPGQNIGAPSLYQGTHVWSRLLVVNLRHAVRGWTDNGLTFRANLSYATDRAITGPLTTASELETREPSLGIELGTLQFAGLDAFPFPVTEEIVRNFRTNTGLRTPYLDREDLRNRQPYRLSPFGLLSGWPTQGLDAVITLISERRLNARAQVEWTGLSGHRLMAGADAGRTRVSFYTSNLLRQAFADVFVVEPTRFGVFAADRVELGRATIELGARYDRFDPGGEFTNIPGRLFSHPAWDNADYEGSVAAVMTEARGRGAFSPRVRFAYRIGERTSVRAAFGQHIDLPPYAVLFTNANGDLSFTNISDPFGRDVDYAKVTILEVGGRHAFGDAMELGVAGYRKTPGLTYGFRPLPFEDPLNPGDTLGIIALANIDEGSVMGLDAELAWRRGETIAAWATYSLAATDASFPGPFGPVDVPGLTTHTVSTAVVAGVPEGWGRGGTLGKVAQGLEAIAVLRLTNGLPYTRLANQGFGYVVPGSSGFLGTQIEPLNASRLPWTKHVDLRVSRTTRVGRLDWTVYADIRNLFGFRNTQALFAETGGVTNDRHRENLLAPEVANLWFEAQDNGVLGPGNTIDLRGCAAWASPVNCVALSRVERRFGDGDGLYTRAEQDRAFNAYYDSFMGAWRFYGPGRTARIGLALEF